METPAEPTIGLLSTASPPRVRQFPQRRPSIPGRLQTIPTVALNAFLNVDPVEDESSSETEETGNQDQHYDGRRRKVKRRGRRIARPRDSMPGFGKRKYGRSSSSRFSSSRFTPRGAGAAGGSRHLDRGISAATYYGKGNTELFADEGTDDVAHKQLGQIEAKLSGGGGGQSVPVCLVHGEPCIALVCKKPGPNKGREFFKCAKKDRFQQCDFFRWADEPPESFSDAEDLDDDTNSTSVVVPAVFEVRDGSEESLIEPLEAFGHSKFRPGQLEAIQLLLKGTSTLALLPTGGGKSLVYQIFAGVRPGLVVVVTPLVSLMLDQLASLPEQLPGACLRGGQTMEVICATEKKLREGLLKVLFITPERLFSSRFRRLMGGRHAPRVSLVVVDEAHCVSQWSHNFRTAYLRIPTALFGKSSNGSDSPVFREDPLVLALTATATTATVQGICSSLRIDESGGVVRCDSIRENLRLTLSRVDGNVDAKAYELVRVLKMDRFADILGIAPNDTVVPPAPEDAPDANQEEPRPSPKKRRRTNLRADDEMVGWGSNVNVTKRVRALKNRGGKRLGSIIVYVTKQKDCESVMNYLRSSTMHLRGQICMYHAGMSQGERTKVQNKFERGSVAILVATVAFGMGLNYANVCGVVHFDMPSSLEGYSQEVGRAGRDGKDASCHVFFSKFDGCRLVSRSHADGIDGSTVRQFIRCLVATPFAYTNLKEQVRKLCLGFEDNGTKKNGFVESSEDEKVYQQNNYIPPTRAKSFILTARERDLSKTLDMKPETAETICAILESEIDGVRLLKWMTTKVRVRFFSKSPEALIESGSRALTAHDVLVIRTIQKSAKEKGGQYDLDLVSASLTQDQVTSALNRLQSGRHISFEAAERGLQVECSADGHQALKGELERWAAVAHERLERIENIRVQKAHAVVSTFAMADEKLSDAEQSDFLHCALQGYFATGGSGEQNKEEGQKCIDGDDSEEKQEQMNHLRRAVLVVSHEDSYGSNMAQSARQIARILHGIDSAGFRAKDWCRCAYWGRFVECDFTETKRVAAEVLREQHMMSRARQTAPLS